MKNLIFFCFPLIIYAAISCKEDNSTAENNTPDIGNDAVAEIVSVSFTGEENKYSFNVGVKSPDTGCNQYADWWEIISPEGELLYRRILGHSHVNEQPFVRSGGPVTITKDQIVYIRAHMNTSGYSDKVFKGSPENGFQKSTLDKTFASPLATQQPLPSGCAF